jgi:hypothetical protein
MRTSSPAFPAMLLTAVACGIAELPPQAYEAMRRGAPEVLTLEVRKVSTIRMESAHATGIVVTADAAVRAITRTKAGLKAGDRIEIAYLTRVFREPTPGAAPTPVLRETSSCTIYLQPSTIPDRSGSYEPAALSRSFDGCNLGQ